MILDTTTLIIFSIVFLLAIATPFSNPFFRKVATDKDTVKRKEEQLPPISILVLACDDARGLEDNLPALLTQDYSSEYEVIVVTEQKDAVAEPILNHYSNNPRLYSTFIPPESLFMSRGKLAVTLGVKATHNEWIILVSPDCQPVSDQWLKTMAYNFNSHNNLVLGYSNYKADAPAYYRFERLRTALYLMRKAQKGKAYRYNGANIAFRRSEFIKNDGYKGNLQHLHGIYDFLVNKYSKNGHTAVEISEDAFIREETPSKEEWNNNNIFYVYTRKHLDNSLPLRLIFDTDMTLMYLGLVVPLATIIYGALTYNFIVMTVAAVAFITMIVERILIAKKTFKKFGETISSWLVIPYEISIIWRQIPRVIRYIQSDKRDFSTHKI